MAFLKDGFKTLISLNGTGAGAVPTTLIEIEITPPGIEGGGKIDFTHMRRTRWRGFAPKQLATMSDMKATVTYDPQAYTAALAAIQINQTITVTFPDGHGITFWGFLDEFKPGALKDGDRPTAEITICPTMTNNVSVEVAPVQF